MLFFVGTVVLKNVDLVENDLGFVIGKFDWGVCRWVLGGEGGLAMCRLLQMDVEHTVL